MSKKVKIKTKDSAGIKSVASPKKSKPTKTKLVEIQTKETSASVEGFINKLKDEQQRKDSFTILEMMKKATGEKPKMWGSSIIGFGNIIYTSSRTGRQVEWMKIGFSPRKTNLSLYLTMDVSNHAAELKKLGKHKTGVGCLYINKLDDVDVKVLNTLITGAAKRKSQF